MGGFRRKPPDVKTFTAEEIAKAPVNTKAVNSLADLGDIDSPPLTESAKARYGQLSPRDAALSIFCLAGMNEAVNRDGSGSRDNKNYETTVAALSLVQIAIGIASRQTTPRRCWITPPRPSI